MMVRLTARSRGASVARAIVILLCLPVFEITAAASTLDANDVRRDSCRARGTSTRSTRFTT